MFSPRQSNFILFLAVAFHKFYWFFSLTVSLCLTAITVLGVIGAKNLRSCRKDRWATKQTIVPSEHSCDRKMRSSLYSETYQALKNLVSQQSTLPISKKKIKIKLNVPLNNLDFLLNCVQICGSMHTIYLLCSTSCQRAFMLKFWVAFPIHVWTNTVQATLEKPPLLHCLHRTLENWATLC